MVGEDVWSNAPGLDLAVIPPLEVHTVVAAENENMGLPDGYARCRGRRSGKAGHSLPPLAGPIPVGIGEDTASRLTLLVT